MAVKYCCACVEATKMDEIEEAWCSFFNLKLSHLVPFLSGKAPKLIVSTNTAYGELLFPKKVSESLLSLRSANEKVCSNYWTCLI